MADTPEEKLEYEEFRKLTFPSDKKSDFRDRVMDSLTSVFGKRINWEKIYAELFLFNGEWLESDPRRARTKKFSKNKTRSNLRDGRVASEALGLSEAEIQSVIQARAVAESPVATNMPGDTPAFMRGQHTSSFNQAYGATTDTPDFVQTAEVAPENHTNSQTTTDIPSFMNS